MMFEVLSPSTRKVDLFVKLTEYQAIESVRMIVYVDPARETIETWKRLSANAWRDVKHAVGAPLRIDDPGLEIPAAEIFARD